MEANKENYNCDGSEERLCVVKKKVKRISFHVNVPRRIPIPKKNASLKFVAKPLSRAMLKRSMDISTVPNAKPDVVKPFSFEEADREGQLKKKRKVEDFWEQAKRERKFCANSVPDLGVPESQKKLETKFQTIHFLAKENEILRKKRAAEHEKSRRLNKLVNFKAKLLVKRAKLTLQKPNRYLSHNSPKFHLVLNALVRKNFERHLAEKEERKKQDIERISVSRELEEKKARHKIGANMVHKAQPIRKLPALLLHRKRKLCNQI